MKTLKKLLATLLLLCLAGMTTAQDVILKKDHSTVLSKVLEVSSTEIKYKKWSNQDGPTYSISCSEVLSINYANGEVDKFTNTNNTQQSHTYQPNNNYNADSQKPIGHLERQGNNLFLNGNKLSKENANVILSHQDYQNYLNAKTQLNYSTAFGYISGFALYMALEGLITKKPIFNKSIKTGAGVLCGISLTTGLILEHSGRQKMDAIVTKYNNQSNSVSYNFSPSIIRYENPQSTNNYGLGVTISMNF